MNRILKKYTTIPDNLYVERNADKELKLIIDELERPGYVLVARQMGKTNLLLHAKRKLENEKRILVYNDLSNSYENEVVCYREIIDNIIENYNEIFEEITDKIDELRSKRLPPHKEYLKCIKQILSIFKGDIIIILDEIDSLKNSNFSDSFFSQIRSSYFARSDTPELSRLSYILSGVIEPKELISNKNKSPFNIGEKIYLDDFTKSEYEDFIKKSRLKLKPDITELIYNWSNGNPRITFDICSEIESHAINNNVIDKELVLSIINKKYLKNFDTPPVDHIRELVKTNKNLRRAVFKIQNSQFDLNDDLKKELYLYGIISSDYENRIEIKNQIIKRSLSLEWLRSFDKFDFINAPNKNLFDSYNARYLSFVDISNSFVITDDFNQLVRNENSIIIGPRGSGKTTLLKMLHPKALDSWNTESAKIDTHQVSFFGIYVPVDIRWQSQLKSITDKIDNETVRNIMKGLLNLNVLRSLCSTFLSLIEQSNATKEFEVELSKILSSNWFFPSSSYSIDELVIEINKVTMEMNTIVQKRKFDYLPTICFSELVDIVSTSIDCIELINKSFSFPISLKKKWALCFDELEIAPQSIREMLFSNLRSRSDQRILFKLTLAPDLANALEIELGSNAMLAHDYSLIKLWIYDSDSQKSWSTFCKEYFLNFFKRVTSSEVPPEELIGDFRLENTSDVNIKDQDKFGIGTNYIQTIKNLAEKDKSFYNYLLKRNIDPTNPIPINRKQTVEVFSKIKYIVYYRDYFLKRGRRLNMFYHGFQSLCTIADGNPRAFINLINEFKLQVKLETNIKTISYVKQSEILTSFSLNYAKSFLLSYRSDIVFYNKLSFADIVNKIGNYFFEHIIFKDFNADPIFSFYIRNGNSDFDDFINTALQIGAIVQQSSNTYRLAHILYPKYKLPLLAGRSIDLRTILNNDNATNGDIFNF